jgi:hypothetical protein
MDTGASPLKEGMAVIGSDMQRVGQVCSVRDTDFGVDRPLQPSLSQMMCPRLATCSWPNRTSDWQRIG